MEEDDGDLDLFSHFNEEQEKVDENEDVGEGVSRKRKLEELTKIQTEVEEPLHKKRKFVDCSHEIAYPPHYDNMGEFQMGIKPTLKFAPVKYPFELDKFQEESISCVEQNRSVLVSAHTSAGKTLVAEYAVSLSLKEGSRCIYTSPIKALSNQKYRDLCEMFDDVGLITGDVTISPNSNCLVMTTEILRTMLYKGHEILTSVKWVIFDEIHYLNDPERGVVWEETIILMPKEVKYVFLSATVPNAFEFASWVAKLKSIPVHVVYTDKRPIPLQHYVYPIGGEGIFLIRDETGVFRTDNFNKMMEHIGQISSQKKQQRQRGGGRRQNRRMQDHGKAVEELIKMIKQRNLIPCIFFAFSRAQIEELAMRVQKIDLTDDKSDKALIKSIFESAIDSLNEDDKKLPQIQNVLPLLERGIGIHHSGLLPIIKEIIEILFSEGLVKVLFATETFAMGLNMPARTCVFVNTKKFDGKSLRFLLSGEYIQMSGRAGRRGKDKMGKVITMMEPDQENEIKKVLLGEARLLISSFRLTEFSILNMLRVEEINMMFLINRSFHKFQEEKKVPKLQEEMEELVSSYNSIEIENEGVVEKYYKVKKELEIFSDLVNKEIVKPINILPFIQVGRMVTVKKNWGYGVVLNFQRLDIAQGGDEYILDLMLPMKTRDLSGNLTEPRPIYTDFNAQKHDIEILKRSEYGVLSFRLNMIQNVSSVRIYVTKTVKKEEKKTLTKMRIINCLDSHKMNIPLLDPVKDMRVSGLEGHMNKIQMLEDKLFQFSSNESGDMDSKLADFQEKEVLKDQIKKLNKRIKTVGKGEMQVNLSKMKNVLKTLKFIDNEDMLTKKGKIAAEISTSDGLVLTELILATDFVNLDVETMGAILSCFVCEISKFEVTSLPEELKHQYQILTKIIMKIMGVRIGNGLIEDQERELQRFSPALMEVTFNWLKGNLFHEITKITDVFEGEIVRQMRRLEELLRNLIMASRVIGEKNMEEKFREVSEKLKRDIIFSGSLYT